MISGPSLHNFCCQAALEELRQVRINLKDAEKVREHAHVAAEQAKHHFTSAESGWRREVENLTAALNEALARDCGKDEHHENSEKKAQAIQPSTATNWEQPSTPQQPQVASTGGPDMPNERPQQPSTSGVSDATSRDLAAELMQKLTDETKQRRSTRQALSDKVKLFLQICSVRANGEEMQKLYFTGVPPWSVKVFHCLFCANTFIYVQSGNVRQTWR